MRRMLELTDVSSETDSANLAISRLKVNQHSSARRAADRSPRREPWVECRSFRHSPEGDT